MPDMYKLLGADKTEYGPVSADIVRDWIKQGRVNGRTQAQLEGETEWKPLSAYAEFASAFANSAAPPPPLPSTNAPTAQFSGLAIASLIFGVLGFVTFGLTALVGLVLGIVGMVKISSSRGTLKGHGLALAGTIVSGFFLLLLPIFAAMLLPALARAKGRAQSIVCMNNMKQLALGEMMYASESKNRFSSAEEWCDSVTKYVGNPRVFLCPAGDPSQRCHYAINSRLAGVEMREVKAPSQTVLLFEINGGWNVSGGPELAVASPRHDRKIGIVFADGHCELRDPRLRSIRWDP